MNTQIELLKFIRVVVETNKKIDYSLEQALKKNVKELKTSNSTLLRDELIKIILSEKPSSYFLLMDKFGFLEVLLPELHACKTIKQELKYHKHDVFTHCIYAMDNTDPSIVLRLAALFHDIGKVTTIKIINNKITFHKHEVASAKIADDIMKRFNFQKKIRIEVTELIKLHMFYYTKEWSNNAIRKFIKKAKIDGKFINSLNNHPLFKIRRADRLGKGMNIKEKDIVTIGQQEFQKRIVEVFRIDRNQNLKKGSLT